MKRTIFNTDDDYKLNWSKCFTDLSQFREAISKMQEYDYTIQLNTSSAAVSFTDIASKVSGDVDVWNVGRQRIVDGKSILGVMTLDLTQPIQVKIRTGDPDEYVQFCNEVKKFSI